MLMFLTCRTVQKGGLLDFAIMTSCDQLVARLLKNINLTLKLILVLYSDNVTI